MVAAIHGCATGDVGNGEPAVMQIDDHPDPRLPTDPRGLEHPQNLFTRRFLGTLHLPK